MPSALSELRYRVRRARNLLRRALRSSEAGGGSRTTRSQLACTRSWRPLLRIRSHFEFDAFFKIALTEEFFAISRANVYAAMRIDEQCRGIRLGFWRRM